MLWNMSAAALKQPPLATIEDLLAIPEEQRYHEIIGGELVPKEAGTGRHGGAQLDLGSALNYLYGRRARGGPGGWVFATDVEVWFETHETYRPDVVGWRRDRLPRLPAEVPIRVRPDWVCEVLSPRNKRTDRVDKFDTYERCGVQHYWILDPMTETLKVHRLVDHSYRVVLVGRRGESIRAEPFEELAFSLSDFLDDGEDT